MLQLKRGLLTTPFQVLRGLELGQAGESCQIGLTAKDFQGPRISIGCIPRISRQLFQHFGTFQAFQVPPQLSLLPSLCMCGIAFTMCQMWSNIMWCYTFLLTEEKNVWYSNHDSWSLVAYILHSMWQDKSNKLVAKPKCKWWFQYFIQD